MQSFPPEDIS